MKPPTLGDLQRIVERLDDRRIEEGLELENPLGADKRFHFGDEWVTPTQLIPLLTKRLLELYEIVGLE